MCIYFFGSVFSLIPLISLFISVNVVLNIMNCNLVPFCLNIQPLFATSRTSSCVCQASWLQGYDHSSVTVFFFQTVPILIYIKLFKWVLPVVLSPNLTVAVCKELWLVSLTFPVILSLFALLFLLTLVCFLHCSFRYYCCNSIITSKTIVIDLQCSTSACSLWLI